MIKAIIFDFGNVIYKFNNDLFIEKLSSYSEKTFHELNELLYGSVLPEQYETGLISSEHFFNDVKKLCNLQISVSSFKNAFINIFTPVQETLDIIDELKPRYRLGLLSNTNEWHFHYVIKKCEIYNCFEAVSLSYIVREMKPGSGIYLHALKKLKLRPEECVYVDDIKEYAEAARRIGIQGVHYRSHGQLVDELKRLGIAL